MIVQLCSPRQPKGAMPGLRTDARRRATLSQLRPNRHDSASSRTRYCPPPPVAPGATD